MKKNPFIAGLLSCIVPGSGHFYRGEGWKGAAILVSAIVTGCSNFFVFLIMHLTHSLVLPLPAGSKPTVEIGLRIVQFMLILWNAVFWFWAVVDAASIPEQDDSLVVSGISNLQDLSFPDPTENEFN